MNNYLFDEKTVPFQISYYFRCGLPSLSTHYLHCVLYQFCSSLAPIVPTPRKVSAGFPYLYHVTPTTWYISPRTMCPSSYPIPNVLHLIQIMLVVQHALLAVHDRVSTTRHVDCDYSAAFSAFSSSTKYPPFCHIASVTVYFFSFSSLIIIIRYSPHLNFKPFSF